MPANVVLFALQVADRLPNAPAVLVTAGEEGAAYCCRSTKGEHTGFVPVFKVDVADTTGAGDAFTAGFVYKVGNSVVLCTVYLVIAWTCCCASVPGGHTWGW
jgi:fructose-1-phosphate kinase PfkB-like protein